MLWFILKVNANFSHQYIGICFNIKILLLYIHGVYFAGLGKFAMFLTYSWHTAKKQFLRSAPNNNDKSLLKLSTSSSYFKFILKNIVRSSCKMTGQLDFFSQMAFTNRNFKKKNPFYLTHNFQFWIHFGQIILYDII